MFAWKQVFRATNVRQGVDKKATTKNGVDCQKFKNCIVAEKILRQIDA
jgi:hypothetical protein